MSTDVDRAMTPQYNKVPLDKIFGLKYQARCAAGCARIPSMPVHPQISRCTASEQLSRSQSCPASVSDDIDSDVHEPQIHFSLYYDIQRRTLTVYLTEGTNLPAKRRGSSDPFVILFLLPDKEEIFETKVQKKTLNPIFNEVFEFSGLLPDEIRRQTLVLRVLTRHALSSTSDELGTATLQLEQADLYGVRVSATLSSETSVIQDNKGDVLISLMYNPSTNIITGILLKATNLQRMDISGSSDPFVEICLIHEGSRQAKWKSTIKKKTLVPIYNERFQFDIKDMNISFVQLEVSVIDYDRLGRNDLMGSFTLGEGSEQSSGQLHWQQMISHPRTPIDRWHSLGIITKRTGSPMLK